MSSSLPETVKDYMDKQVAAHGFGTSSEYIQELISRDKHRQRLRVVILDGASSEPATSVGPAYFQTLQDRVRKSASE